MNLFKYCILSIVEYKSIWLLKFLRKYSRFVYYLNYAKYLKKPCKIRSQDLIFDFVISRKMAFSPMKFSFIPTS